MTPQHAALTEIRDRKKILSEAYGFTEEDEAKGVAATEIDDIPQDGATQRAYGWWQAYLTLERILDGE